MLDAVSRLLELVCGDEPAAWSRLGFAITDGELVRLGPVTVRLTGGGGGLRGWTLDGDGGPAKLDGIATTWSAGAGDAAAAPVHPNGASELDHVVVMTGSRDRTAAALRDAGGDERRRVGPPVVPVPMAFVRLGETIVEVAEAGGPARLWGLVAVVPGFDDLDGTLVGDPRGAVQPGRWIATVRRAAGLGTELAFMSPRVRAR
jgi:hypothetical protein